jgi:hypothetical protein
VVLLDIICVILTFCWHFVGILLAFCWHFVGIMLAFCWHYVGIMLALRWKYVGIMLALCWHFVGIPPWHSAFQLTICIMESFRYLNSVLLSFYLMSFFFVSLCLCMTFGILAFRRMTF